MPIEVRNMVINTHIGGEPAPQDGTSERTTANSDVFLQEDDLVALKQSLLTECKRFMLQMLKRERDR